MTSTRPSSSVRAALAAPARALIRPFEWFAGHEAAGGLLLLGAAVLALAWANSPWADSYHAIFEGHLPLPGGLSLPVHALVNDGLMAVFFFTVGMEIQRELVKGDLRSFDRALLPAVAALGGMVVPAGIYAALNWGTPGMRGWAIPMATDIAFSLGVLGLLAGRVARPLVVFLTALAIFDDMGGILVIALFYGSGLSFPWLGAAALLFAGSFVAGRRGLSHPLAWLLLGGTLWWTVHEAGIHATIAGVLLGFCIPPLAPGEQAEPDGEGHAAEAPLDRFLHALHGWVAFGILPVFALANSGVDLSGLEPSDLLAPVCLGSAVGLFIGKQVGIFALTWLAVRARVSPMPGAAPLSHLHGVAIIGGIGFTVALFIAGLAFSDPVLLAEAKLGILLGSLASGLAGYGWLRVVTART